MARGRAFDSKAECILPDGAAPSRLLKARAKMRQWIDNAAALGWLIDADRRTVYVYRPGREPEELVDVDHLRGEGIVEGFRLELGEIWRGL